MFYSYYSSNTTLGARERQLVREFSCEIDAAHADSEGVARRGSGVVQVLRKEVYCFSSCY